MNDIIIGVAGYTLLLSNFILLMLLIKNKFKHQLVSSFCILSTSDILNSVLTAVILLINYIDITTRTNYFCENTFILNTDITDEYLNTFLRFSKTYNSSDSHYFNETSCNVKDILMHNAMFLMPFTNAFISLLIFSIQFNLNATSIDNKHKSYLQFWMEIKQNGIMNTDNSNSREEELKAEKNINEGILNITETGGKIPHVSQNIKFGNIFDVNKGIVGMSVLGQWLIPILFTGVLYFADYKNIDMILQNKSTEYMYDTPSFFYNCFLKKEDIVSMENTHSQLSIIPVYNASFTPLHNQNITENDVISKIYDIMHVAYNYTYDGSNDPGINKFSNYYELSQIKRNTNENIIINDIKNNMNTTNFETNYNEWTIVDDHNIESNISTSENLATIKDNYKDTKLSEIVIPYTMNKCVISTTFLRLYFLMLMFIMYFLPIMLSSVLQVQGKLMCQNILSKLKEHNLKIYSSPDNKLAMENDNKVLWKSKVSNDSHSSKEHNDEEQGRNNSTVISGHKHNQEKIYEDLLKESIQVEKLFGMIKASLIMSIILWTPIFLQAALQILLCIYVSTWIIDCTFLCAISSCIIRNIFNLKIAKTQEIQKNVCKKGNTVYPVEENI